MLNHPNTRANTVISQSFIASEFQGYNDPFVSSQPTSSLNQFVRSKQTSDSGFIQDGENQSFGFGNITANHEPTKLESLSKKANQQNTSNVSMPKQSQPSEYLNPQQNQVNQAQFNQSSQMRNQENWQQVALGHRYLSPGIIKTDSPTKLNQFVQNNPNIQSNFPPQQTPNQFPNQISQLSSQNKNQFVTNQQPFYKPPQQQSFNQNTNINSGSQFSNQQSKSIVQTNQTFSSNNRPPTQTKNETTTSSTSIGGRLKLNVSQQFSNSFTLNCVTQPQRSNILQMKKRQRQYRKSIQNFFV